MHQISESNPLTSYKIRRDVIRQHFHGSFLVFQNREMTIFISHEPVYSHIACIKQKTNYKANKIPLKQQYLPIYM